MTTLSNILRWFTVSFYKGEVESDIADAYKWFGYRSAACADVAENLHGGT